jgi:hypothetical protein
MLFRYPAQLDVVNSLHVIRFPEGAGESKQVQTSSMQRFPVRISGMILVGSALFAFHAGIARSQSNPAIGQPPPTVDPLLQTEITSVRSEITAGESELEGFGPGLIKSLVQLRLATLRQTLALLAQRQQAAKARTVLHYTVNGQVLSPGVDVSQQLIEVQQAIAEVDAGILQKQTDADRYGSGLIKSLTLSTLATMQQTRAMLDQKRLALRFGLPQFIGFSNSAGAVSSAIGPTASTGSDPGRQRETAPPVFPVDCMKVVFGSYCLGAPSSALPPPDRKEESSWVYARPQPTVIVVEEGRIANVVRLYTPASWLKYQELENDLITKYGTGDDLSSFPSYADDASSRETSISLGKGRAARQWKLTGFTIQLKWTTRDNVVLAYYHDELEAKREKKKQSAY